MDYILNKVKKYIKDNKLINQGDKIIIGLSGGGDSVCLYKILLELKDELDITPAAVHVNHGIRGEEALRDQEFVEKMCRADNVPVKVFSYDVPKIAEEMKMSEEEAGRYIRYRCFNDYADEIGANKIAVAHNLNDDVETFLHNICRGTGISGLRGIAAASGNVIRPVLCLTRSEINEYNLENGNEYVNDSTNEGMDYTRNKIRNSLIPFLTEEINEKADRHIYEVIRELAEINDVIEEKVSSEIENCIDIKEENGDIYINRQYLKEIPSYMAKRVIRKAIELKIHKLKDITRIHINDIYGLLDKPRGKYVSLPYGLKAVSEYEYIKLTAVADCEDSTSFTAAVFPKEKLLNDIPFFKGKISNVNNGKVRNEEGEIPIEDYINKLKKEQKLYTKVFDYDKIKTVVIFDTAQENDYIVINSAGGRKTIKKFFKDEKISGDKRKNLLVLAEMDDPSKGRPVIWIPGYRISENYKVDKDTLRILELEYIHG